VCGFAGKGPWGATPNGMGKRRGEEPFLKRNLRKDKKGITVRNVPRGGGCILKKTLKKARDQLHVKRSGRGRGQSGTGGGSQVTSGLFSSSLYSFEGGSWGGQRVKLKKKKYKKGGTKEKKNAWKGYAKRGYPYFGREGLAQGKKRERKNEKGKRRDSSAIRNSTNHNG